MFKRKQNKAFTLAEVLITLLIIGVVAAITVPVLVQSINDQALVASAKKDYSVLNQVLLTYKFNNGGSLAGAFSPDNNSNYSLDQLTQYLKISKKCRTTDICWTENTKFLNNVESDPLYLGKYTASAILADGTRITVKNTGSSYGEITQWNVYNNDGSIKRDESGNPVTESGISRSYGDIYIDTNGAKGPNQYGYDTWRIRIKDYGINGCLWGYAWGCLETVIKTGKLVKPKS